MNGETVAWIILWAAFYLFSPLAIIRGGALLFCLFPLANYVYLYILAAFVRIQRRDPLLRTYRNHLTQVELIIENRSYLPLLGALLRDGGGQRLLVSLAPRERRVVDYKFIPHERGEFELGPLVLHIQGFFKTDDKNVKFNAPGTLIVYPDIYPLDYPAPPGSPLGSLKSQRRIDEDPTRFRSIREYVPGDERRRINWKASARSGILYCNDYEATSDTPLTIFLNLRTRDYPLKNRYLQIEQAVEYAGSLVSAASRCGQAVGLACTGFLKGSQDPILVPAVTGTATALLDILARVEADPAENPRAEEDIFMRAAAILPYRSQAWYVGPDPGDLIRLLAETVRRRGVGFRLYLPELSKQRSFQFRSLNLESHEMEGELHV